VQEGGASSGVPLVLLALVVALLFWGWRQDWTSDSRNEQPSDKIVPPLREPAAPPSPPLSDPPAQRAGANLVSYFTDDDYPVAALRNGEQGTVSFVLAVSNDGRVTSCSVAESSGSSTLDAATCRLLRSRARFQPARNANGQAVPDEARGRIRWVLPAG
jgi:protein TonB